MKRRVFGAGKRLATIPVPATLFVLALGLFVWGAYVVTPWYTPAAPIDIAFNTRPAEIGLGIVYMFIGGIRIFGAVFKKKRLMLFGPYGMMMGYLFLAILRITVVGLTPLTWLPLITCAVISGICRLALLHGDDELE